MRNARATLKEKEANRKDVTWVCAASTIYGYGALYSDVQVTFPDGSTRDLLQKAYPLTNSIAAGFAGSVHIGFQLLQSLSDFLRLPDEDHERVGLDPRWVAREWCPLAKAIFAQASPTERALRSQLLLVGASPNEQIALGAKVYITRFSSPAFRPGIMSRPVKLCHIGSGAKVAAYKRRLKPLFRLTSGILRAEIGEPGGWARQLGFSMGRALADHPRKGISKHLHIIIIRRGTTIVGTNDEDIYPKEGSIIEFRMPPVAQNYPAFQALSAAAGHDAAGATC
jgi:hypothetical protein